MTPKMTTPTPFGKYVRRLRIDRSEYMKDMAERLGVSAAYLSAVETGRRNAPYEWAERLQRAYSLSEKETERLRGVISDSRSYENLNVAHLSIDDRRLMRLLSEQLPEWSQERRAMLAEWLGEPDI